MHKKLLIALTASLLAWGAHAQDTKIGALMDVTGPIANFMPPLQNAAALAIKHINAQGGLL